MEKMSFSHFRAMEAKKKSTKASKATSKEPAPRPCSYRETPTVDLNLRIANAFKSVIVTTRNEEFREKCLDILGVTNGSEAGEKIEALLKKFKGSKKAK